MSLKKVLTIAGSDTSGGAGIQADLKTFQERGVYGMSAITVIVAMEPKNWAHKVFPVELSVIKEQVDTVIKGIGIDALKTGMLPTVEIIEYVGSVLKDVKKPIVIDPVMVCKVNSEGEGNAENLFPENVEAMKKYLLPYATVVTPNLFEAAQLAGMETIKTIDEAKEAAKKIHELGAKNVVIKGRTFFAGENSVDLLYDGKDFEFFESKKIDTKWNHGAGCTFSASITAEIAKGATVSEAVKTTKELISNALKDSFPLNNFAGPINHKKFALK